jgi:hypothetical protein
MTRSRRVAPGTVANASLRKALGGFAAAVVRLHQVDPVTTELVRMRCAHYHDCGT